MCMAARLRRVARMTRSVCCVDLSLFFVFISLLYAERGLILLVAAVNWARVGCGLPPVTSLPPASRMKRGLRGLRTGKSWL